MLVAVLLASTDSLRKPHALVLSLWLFRWTSSAHFEVIPLLPLRTILGHLICHRAVIGVCLQYLSLLLNRKPGVISFWALFEERTYFLLISNGIIHNSHIFIFALAARKPIGNYKSTTATLQSRERRIWFPLLPRWKLSQCPFSPTLIFYFLLLFVSFFSMSFSRNYLLWNYIECLVIN